jgi:glycosyltransferase involved in cell wall biosynthesis
MLRGYGNRMRIAHVAPSVGRSASGILTAIGDLTAAIARRGHDVALWYNGDRNAPRLRAMIPKLEQAGVRCLQLDASRRTGEVLPTVGLPAGTVVDLVHLHSVFVPMNAALSRAWSGPVVVSPHGGYDPISLRRSFLRKKAYSALYEKAMVRRSATAVALTEVEAAQIRAYAGAVTTAVVPNGVTPRSPNGDGMRLRDALGICPDVRLALFVGRLDVRHKGLDRLIAAARAAPTWRFLLVGPDYRGGLQRLQRMAAGLDVSGRFCLAGQWEAAELTDAYSAADLFMLPSRWEGLPMSLLEALAHSTPALVTPEVDRLVPVSSRGAGWVCAPSDLGRTLEAIAALPSGEWSRRADAARDLARDYDWDRVAAAYEEVYRAALQRWTAGGRAAREAFPR